MTPDIGKNQRIGLLAGGGQFPILFAQAARAQGLSVFCVGSWGMVSPDLADLCDDFHVVPVARIGKAIRLFRRANVRQVVMAGKIEKTVLLQPLRMFRLLPDWRAIHMWIHFAKRDGKDDSLLLAVIKEFERDEIYFKSALEFCPELLVKHGFLTRRRPTPAQWADIRFGWDIACQMGRLDIGQSVAVSDRAVIAVEAIEGTDRMIERAGDLCRRGGFSVVKVAKPQQDMRFDVPTIGAQTISTMHACGARALAIESGRTIVLEESEVIDLANKLGISIVSLNSQEVQLGLSA